MPKRKRKSLRRKIVLRLPDLDQAKSAVLNSLGSPHARAASLMSALRQQLVTESFQWGGMTVASLACSSSMPTP